MTLIASFLAGSLLTLLLPVFLLLALVLWYLLFLRGVPGPIDAEEAAATPAATGRGTDVPVADHGPSVAISDEANRLPDA